MFEKKYNQQSKSVFNKETNKKEPIKNFYLARVVSIDDELDAGRIKVRIPDLDNEISDANLSYCYPVAPMFIWHFPKIGEMVRIWIEDSRFPQKGRHWTGSIISQPQKVKFDDSISALSTTGYGTQQPDVAISSIPEAIGVFPNLEDIGLIGRDNTDVILRERELEIRCGKHKFDDIFQINRLNPALIKMNFEDEGLRSSIIMMADKLALLTHSGDPKFKTVNIDKAERDRIFNEAHPTAKADILIAALELMRRAILQHVHGYSGIPADKSKSIIDLEKIDFQAILSKNIVIN